MLKKHSWTGRDLVQALGIDAAFTGGLGAIGIGSGGASGLTGAVSGLLGGTAPAGVGIGAAIAAHPISWIIGGVMASGLLAYTIYSTVKQSDDNLNDLIDRIESLDYEDTLVNDRVQGWIDALKEKVKFMQLPVLGAMNEQEKALQLAQKVVEIQDVKRVLDSIWADWPETKKYLEDWKIFPYDDPADFEYAFKKTYAAINKSLSDIRKQAQSAAKGVINSAKNPDPMIAEIRSLDYQISSIWGKPQYTEDEKKTLEMAGKIVERKVTTQEFSDYLPKLVSIRDQLKNLLQVAKRKAKLAKEDAIIISKRAVSLPDKPTAKPSGAVPAKTKPISKQRRMLKNDVVAMLQSYINHLHIALDIPGETLDEDGIYGPKTARALAQTLISMNKFDPSLLNRLKWQGIPTNKIEDIQFMSSNPGFINYITKEVGRVSQAVRKSGPAALEQKQQQGQQQEQSQEQRPKQMPDAWNKQFPSKEEVLSELSKTYATIGGSRVNLYDYARTSLGLNDIQIYSLIVAKFGNTAPKNWSIPLLVKSLGRRHSIF